MGLIPRPERTSPLSECFYFALDFASRVKNLPARIEAKRRCESIQCSRNASPVLNYGLAAPRSGMRLPIGGEVKLIPLKQRFPEQFQDFNLVYLVSSALPHGNPARMESKRSRLSRVVW